MKINHSPLGLWTLVGLVVANMIGAGVFTTSGFALGDLGSPVFVIIAWIIGGLIALSGAVSYGALARVIPESGGEYLFLSRAVHPLAGFLAGWVSLLAGFTGAIAFAAITFVSYTTPALADTARGDLVASVLILLAAALHGITLRPGALTQNFSVALKLVLIGGFCVYALTFGGVSGWPAFAGDPSAPDVALPAIASFALTLMWISFSYSGFNAAVYIAGEVPSAAALVPRALVIGTALTTIAYLALNAIFVLAPNYETVAFQQDVAAIAASAVGGENLERLVRALIALALFTSVSAMIMIGPRVYARMADDGLLPATLRFRGQIPASAVWMQAAIAIVVVWITGLRELLSYLGFTLGLSTAATVATLFVIVRREPALRATLPGYPWAPLMYTSCTLLFAALAATQSPVEMIAALVTLATGTALYLLLSRSGETGAPGTSER